jgi:hypothetical protein
MDGDRATVHTYQMVFEDPGVPMSPQETGQASGVEVRSALYMLDSDEKCPLPPHSFVGSRHNVKQAMLGCWR